VNEQAEIEAETEESAAMEASFKSPCIEQIRDMPMNGDGIRLRNFKLADAEPFADMECCDPIAKKYFPQPNHDRAEFIRSYSPDRMDGYAIEVLPEHAFAGQASIRKTDKLGQGEVRIVIATKYRGRHLGRKAAALLIPYAFEKMNANSLLAVIHPNNRSALKLVGLWKFKYCGKENDNPNHWQYGHLRYELASNTYFYSKDGNRR